MLKVPSVLKIVEAPAVLSMTTRTGWPVELGLCVGDIVDDVLGDIDSEAELLALGVPDDVPLSVSDRLRVPLWLTEPLRLGEDEKVGVKLSLGLEDWLSVALRLGVADCELDATWLIVLEQVVLWVGEDDSD